MNGFLRRLLAALVAIVVASPALAEVNDCSPWSDLQADDAHPALYRVRDGVEKSFFQINGYNGEPCPSANVVCRENAYLIGGDFIVVTSVMDGYVCAGFTNEGRENVTTAGWLPVEEVEPVTLPAAAPEDFVGTWGSGEEQDITVTIEDGLLKVSGEATFGAAFPERVKTGRVNVGAIYANVLPEGNVAAWTDPGDGTTEPWQPGGADYTCTTRLWALPPFLVASDNGYCGGQGVSFTGVYAPTE